MGSLKIYPLELGSLTKFHSVTEAKYGLYEKSLRHETVKCTCVATYSTCGKSRSRDEHVFETCVSHAASAFDHASK
jgi:hypothetical protein